MNFYKFIHYIVGYCSFSASKNSFPPLANLLARLEINFFGVGHKEGKTYFSVSSFDAEKVIKIAEENDISIAERKRGGISFALIKHKNRVGLLIGLLFSCAFLLFSELFVWEITVVGNDHVSDAEILQALSDIGVSVGAFIPAIDVKADNNLLLMRERALSSAAISIEGTNIKVSVLERVKAPERENFSGCYYVAAKCDGYILDVDAFEGKPEVNVGAVVRKGELLINPFMKTDKGLFRAVHAKGKIYAAVSEIIEFDIPLKQIEKRYSGKTSEKVKPVLLGKELPSLSSFESPYAFSDAVFSEEKITLFGFIKLPITRYGAVYYEYSPAEITLSGKEAEENARDVLLDKLAAFDEEILSVETEITFDEEKGVCHLKADALLKRDIALEVEISPSDVQSIAERLSSARE